MKLTWPSLSTSYDVSEVVAGLVAAVYVLTPPVMAELPVSVG